MSILDRAKTIADTNKAVKANYPIILNNWTDSHSSNICLADPTRNLFTSYLKDAFTSQSGIGVRFHYKQKSNDQVVRASAWVVQAVANNSSKKWYNRQPISIINKDTGVISIKPHTPNAPIILRNITDKDLDNLRLCSINKQGGIAYCWNCTKNLANANKKWRYIFLNLDESGQIVEC